MNTLTGIIVTPDSALRAELEDVLSRIKPFSLIRHGAHPITGCGDLGPLFVRDNPSVVFLDVSDMSRALEIAMQTERHLPEAHLVAIARHADAGTISTAMRTGAREFLTLPLRVEETREALCRLQASLHSTAAGPMGKVLTFVPAKPGAGASTVCLNMASALAKVSGKRVALLDFDLSSGSLDFMLNLEPGYSVRDVAEHAGCIDDVLWQQMVTKVGQLDVLRAGKPDANRIPTAARLNSLIRYARQRYEVVCVDLGGTADAGSVEALRASTHILIVSTAEIASLYMAGRMVRQMQEMDLEDRLSVVINRIDARLAISRAHMEEQLGVPVIGTIPNHYTFLQRAMSEGKSVVQGGFLAKRFIELAEVILRPAQDVPKVGMLGYLKGLIGGRQANV